MKGANLDDRKDTIKLLRECDAGIKMGVQSIEDSLKYTSNGELKRTLEKILQGMWRYKRSFRDF